MQIIGLAIIFGLLNIINFSLGSRGDGEAVAVNGDQRFPTASLIKVAVMAEVFRQMEQGKFRKDKNIVPINSDYDLYSMGPDGASGGPPGDSL